MLRKVTDSLSYRIQWARLGVYYLQKPVLRSMLLQGKRVPLSFPKAERETQEHEFGRIVFEDCYRLCEIPKPVRTVVDIGANIGLFALAARAHFPTCAIHCWEPNPSVYPYLDVHCASAGAILHKAAVGHSNGRVFLNSHENSLHTTTSTASDGDVLLESFSSITSRIGAIDVMKLDCEGAEWDLFRSEGWEKVRRVVMEYHLWAKADLTTVHLEDELGRLGFDQITVEPYGPSWGFAWATRTD